MESSKQPITSSNQGRYQVWKYLWRVILGGLVLLSFESLIGTFDPQNIYYSNINFIFIFLGYLGINLLVSRIVIGLDAWREIKSLKTATLALGSFILSVLIAISSNIFPLYLIIPCSLNSLILSIIGLVLGNTDKRKGNLPNTKAGVLIKLNMIALVGSIVIMVLISLLIYSLIGFRGF